MKPTLIAFRQCPNSWRKMVLLGLTALIPPASLLAQNPPVKFERLGLEQGVSSNAIYCILQDHQGFMWFGTEDGLNKYDGYNVTVYYNDAQDSSSLSGNHVTAIFEDRSGMLWIGTNGHGINRFNRETEQFTRFGDDPKNANSLSSKWVKSIYEDSASENKLWLGTDNGLYVFDRVQEQFTLFVNDPKNPNSISANGILSIYEDHTGTLWIGTINGLNKLVLSPAAGGVNSSEGSDRNKEQFIHLFHDPKNPHTLSSNDIGSIIEDHTGTLWLGTWGGGLNKFDREREQFIHFVNDPKNPHSLSSNNILRINEGPTGTLWIGTPDGLNQFDRENEQFTRFVNDPKNSHSLSHNHVQALWEDRSGILWAGTALGVLNKLDRGKEQFTHFVNDPYDPNSLSNNSIWSMKTDPISPNTLWIGTHGGGLNRLDRETSQFTHFVHDPINPHSLSYDAVHPIFFDHTGTLWVGTRGGGLNKLDREKEQFSHYQHDPNNPNSLSSNNISSISEDHAGILWIGTIGGGLNRFDPKSEQFTRFVNDPKNPHGISFNDIFPIYEDRTGTLWIGTFYGLNKLDRDKEQFTRYFHDPQNSYSLIHNMVASIFEDHSGTLWIGTAGGLNKFDRETEHFTHYTEKDGLPNNTVMGILEDNNGRLWLSTGKGLSHFDPKTETFRNYNVSDGLQSNNFWFGSFHKSSSGEMFFGGFNGFNVFHPNSIKDNPYIPPVVITAFKRYNTDDAEGIAIAEKGISAKKEIQVSYKDNIMNFEFAALSYRNTSKNQYAYKLEGFNDNWIHLGAKRDVTFTNLDPGEYTLRVKGSNNDGVWNEEGTSLKITITPPWWKTRWAYAFYVLLVMSLLYGWRRYDLHRVKLRNELRMKNFEAQKLQEVDHMKSRFFANISHEFRTPLTLILGQIDSAIPTIVQEKTKNKMQMAFRNARQLLRLINQLLDLSKIEAGSMALKARRANLIPFLKNLVFSFESLAEQKRITLEFHTTLEEIEIYFEPEKLEKVFFNLLANAFKFTPEGGKISVQLSVISDQISPKQLKTDHWLLITVKDTGIGIPANELSRIFDRFYQVDGTHTREHEGTGIGLALAKELVELHRGEITVTSEVGVGTEFVVKLPLGDQHLKTNEIIEQATPLAAESDYLTRPSEEIFIPTTATPLSPFAPVENKPATDLVLIVEDNADVRSYIREHLEEHYKILEAANGEEGMAKAQESIPDLIITDVMMPKMDGFAFSRLLRNDEKTSHIPIIMLTAKASLESKIEGLETGVDDYLTKPFSPKELLARVRNLITLRRQLRERFSTATIIKPSEVSAVSVDQVFLQRVLSAIEANMGEEEFSVENLAAEVHMSVSQLNRKLNGLIDQPAGQLMRSMRLQRAADLLQQNAGTVAEIAYQVGFGSQAHFTTMFQKQFGCTPGEYRKGQRAEGMEQRA